MAEKKTIADKTSADDKSIGFEYQYYFFLYTLLNLGLGESVGLEVEDDVSTTLNANSNILYQVKHTVQKTSAGVPDALTELDPALWKTLSNWSKIIQDPADKRADVQAQLDFVRRTHFHLVSNKSSSTKNRLLAAVVQFQDGQIDYPAVRNIIADLQKKATGESTKGFISDVSSLSEPVAKQFFSRIRFELDKTDIFASIKKSLLEKAIDPLRVDAAFERLDSNIRKDNFLTVSGGKSVIIKFDDFLTRYRKIFEDARGKTLKYTPFKPDLPDDIFSQPFIQQLLKINDIAPTDEELAIKYTTHKIRLADQLLKWQQAGEIVGDEIDSLHEEVKFRWDLEFTEAYKSCEPDKVVATAQAILSVLRREKYRLAETELQLELSNGELYALSDRLEIGWHKDWQK